MNVEIAERLAKRRREAGFSQEGLAEKLGVTRQAVSKWERSESSPDTDNLIALAELYGVSLDELLHVDPQIKEDVFEAGGKSQSQNTPNEATASDQAPNEHYTDGKDAPIFEAVGKDGEYVRVNLKDGVHIKDSENGGEVHIGWEGVKTNSSKQNNDDFEDDKWCKVEPVIINGNLFETMEELEQKYEQKYENRSPWTKFPFPLIAVLVWVVLWYLTGNGWTMGVFVLLTIPIYYIVVKGVIKRQPAKIFAGVYPILCAAAFLLLGLFYGLWHPAWIIFLTIPIFEWACSAISKSYKKRAQTAPAEKTRLDPEL